MDNRDETGHQRVKTDHDPVKLNHSRHNSPGVGDDGSRESSTDRTSQHHGRRDGSTELRASRQGSREHRADSMESRASHHLQPPEHRRSPDNHQPGSTEYRYSRRAGSTEHRGDQRTEPSEHHEDRRAGSREHRSHRRDGSPEHRDFHRTGSMERRGHRRDGSSEHRDYCRKESAERRDYRPGNGTAAGITTGNQGTIMTPTDLLDAGTGVDLQATRTEAAVDIRQPHTATMKTMKILLGVTPVTGAIGLRNVVTPLFDVGLIMKALHHNTVGHGAHAKPQASWKLQVPHRGTHLQSQPTRSPQSSPQGRGSPPTCNLEVHLGTAVSWSTGTGGDFVYAGCFSQAAVHTQFQTRLLPSEL